MQVQYDASNDWDKLDNYTIATHPTPKKKKRNGTET